MRSIVTAAAIAATAISGTSAAAAVVTYTSQSAFETALDASFTVIDTSNAAFTNRTTTDVNGDAIMTDANAAFIGPDALFRSDGLIQNGSGFYGNTNPDNFHVGINFFDGVNGVGAFANAGDGGTVIAYSGLDFGGVEVGRVAYSSLFGGLIADTIIRSVEFTCEFNFDLACGVIDPQFGTTSDFVNAQVPLPASAALLLGGLGLLGALRRRT